MWENFSRGTTPKEYDVSTLKILKKKERKTYKDVSFDTSSVERYTGSTPFPWLYLFMTL